MSIRSALGNISHNVNDVLSTVLSTSKIQVENIIGTSTTSLSNVSSGGFTGMSESGLAELKTHLTSYCEEVQGIIGEFDQTGDITSALKGEAQTAAYDFIASIKELLQAYVSTMKQEIEEIDEAYNNFINASQSIATDTRNDADEIRSNASSISLD